MVRGNIVVAGILGGNEGRMLQEYPHAPVALHTMHVRISLDSELAYMNTAGVRKTQILCNVLILLVFGKVTTLR